MSATRTPQKPQGKQASPKASKPTRRKSAGIQPVKITVHLSRKHLGYFEEFSEKSRLLCPRCSLPKLSMTSSPPLNKLLYYGVDMRRDALRRDSNVSPPFLPMIAMSKRGDHLTLW